MKLHVLMLAGVMAACALPVRAQEPPPTAPPPTAPPPTAPPPVQEQPPTGQPPALPQPPSTLPAGLPSALPLTESLVTIAPAVPPLSAEALRSRRKAIFLMEGLLINAVKLAAQETAEEIQRIQPGLMMFSSAPVKAHGIYLEDHGVVFHVEIPRVIPSVASLVETLGRDALNRERMGRGNPAQPMSLASGDSQAMLSPDAHYVASIKAELINAMVQHSQSMGLRPGEILTVSARDGSEMPGQVEPPSTMTLRVRASDLADFAAGRITLDEVRRRVSVRGF